MNMSLRAKVSLIAAAHACLAWAAPVWAAMDGMVRVSTRLGTTAAVPVGMDIPRDWRDIRLVIRGMSFPAKAHAILKGQGASQVAIAFAGLPGSGVTDVLIFTGEYRAGVSYRGRLLGGAGPASASIADTKAMLDGILAGDAMGLRATGRFTFPSGVRSFAPANLYGYAYPPTGYMKNGVPVYKGYAPSGDPNNPCPLGPCWTDAGVGRHLEYYAGPIQNPGRPSRAAGFNRGVPEAWTREGQIEAQLVGIQRSRLLYDTIGRYAWPNWGFFWVLW